mmetsp:Transcript_62551/g.146722  ORF Transcript_62551/g.146722 Transcript_62551/m.146722 type:complete len:205 (+) Transcript_62551:398-1012(+)
MLSRVCISGRSSFERASEAADKKQRMAKLQKSFRCPCSWPAPNKEKTWRLRCPTAWLTAASWGASWVCWHTARMALWRAVCRLVKIGVTTAAWACFRVFCTCSVATDSKNRAGTSSFRAARVWCAMPKSRALRAWPGPGMGRGDFRRRRPSSSTRHWSSEEESTTCSRRVAKKSTELRTLRTTSLRSKSGHDSTRSSSVTSNCT